MNNACAFAERIIQMLTNLVYAIQNKFVNERIFKLFNAEH